MHLRGKCPHCSVKLRISNSSVACPSCGGGILWSVRRGQWQAAPVAVGGFTSDGIRAIAEMVEVGVAYFRTNPPGWHTVDGEGNRVRKVTKAEAEAIREEDC